MFFKINKLIIIISILIIFVNSEGYKYILKNLKKLEQLEKCASYMIDEGKIFEDNMSLNWYNNFNYIYWNITANTLYIKFNNHTINLHYLLIAKTYNYFTTFSFVKKNKDSNEFLNFITNVNNIIKKRIKFLKKNIFIST